mmetsp:Transcript_44097/g.103162  ORF Transcript_44097/g.103162 Transcript_44097/m.103162 type:complete len:287 (-) Transcript_44097:204-1064(-)
MAFEALARLAHSIFLSAHGLFFGRTHRQCSRSVRSGHTFAHTGFEVQAHREGEALCSVQFACAAAAVQHAARESEGRTGPRRRQVTRTPGAVAAKPPHHATTHHNHNHPHTYTPTLTHAHAHAYASTPTHTPTPTPIPHPYPHPQQNANANRATPRHSTPRPTAPLQTRRSAPPHLAPPHFITPRHTTHHPNPSQPIPQPSRCRIQTTPTPRHATPHLYSTPHLTHTHDDEDGVVRKQTRAPRCTVLYRAGQVRALRSYSLKASTHSSVAALFVFLRDVPIHGCSV